VEQFRVDPDSFRQAGQTLQDVADRLQQAWAAFSAQVQGMGDIFGDDMVGSLIGMSYGAAHGIADGAYTDVVEGLSGFAGGLTFMADSFDDIEQGNMALLQGVYGGREQSAWV
jgi:hypothetical protein